MQASHIETIAVALAADFDSGYMKIFDGQPLTKREQLALEIFKVTPPLALQNISR